MVSTSRRTLWLVAALMVAACGGTEEAAPQSSEAVATTVPAPSTNPPGTAAAVESTVPGPIELDESMDADLEPGVYFVDHDADPATSLRAQFTISDSGWGSFVGTNKSGPTNESGYVAVKFLEASTVASAACDGTVWVDVGDSAVGLANGLSEIEDFITKEELAAVSAFGYPGFHLLLEIPDMGTEVWEDFTGCDDRYFDGYEGPTLSRFYQGPHQMVEFWVLDVEGTPLLIEATWFPESPAEDVAQLQAILDSVVITP